MGKYAVTINFHAHYGYIEYDPDTKSANVVLDDEAAAAKAAVEKYLSEPHTFRIACGETIRDFKEVTLNPLDSLEAFQQCLTRMWVATDVRVEWSMPPGMAETCQEGL